MEGVCDECGVEFPADQGTAVEMEFWTFDPEGREDTVTRLCILCPACAEIEAR